jgi:hypothetical protein
MLQIGKTPRYAVWYKFAVALPAVVKGCDGAVSKFRMFERWKVCDRVQKITPIADKEMQIFRR